MHSLKYTVPIFWTTKISLSWRAKAGLVLMETAVFRVEIPETGALCYKKVQKWVIRSYTRAAAVQE